MAELRGDDSNNQLHDNSADDVTKIFGGAGNDQLSGILNSDILFGEAGDDHLYGGANDDVLIGGVGADWMYGEDGNDLASYYFSSGVKFALDGSFAADGEAVGDHMDSIEFLEGSRTGADTLAGNNAFNVLWGYGGNDKLHGRGGDDELFGDDGNDKLFGDDGDDILTGGAGSDRLDGGAGEDIVSYYYDNAGVTVSLDNKTFARGAAQGDKFVSIENLYGSATGADFLGGNKSNNDINGFGGNDKIVGRGGNDFLNGGAGNDALDGGAGKDYLHGGSGIDRLNGGGGMDVASYYYSEAGLTVSLDKSLVATGDAIGDTFKSIENLEGSFTGGDMLAGNKRANTIWGFGGDDSLNGGRGDDDLYGGDGNDMFVFDSAKAGTDTIHDFASGDKIALKASGFSGLTAGVVDANQFVFDTTDNTLWFDQDGSEPIAAIKIAVLSNGYDITSNDLIII
jgi:Ca2+-binding RTX toxin-like protein